METKKEACSYCLGSGKLTGETHGWAAREVTDTCLYCCGSGVEPVTRCALCLAANAVARVDGNDLCERCLGDCMDAAS